MTYIHNINPVMFEIFSIKLYWYGFMYALSFIIIDYLIVSESKNKKNVLNKNQAEKFTITILLFAILGGRLGYVFFYDFDYFSMNIINIFSIWEGGMSFHGGLLGAALGTLYFAKTNDLEFFDVSDLISLYAPIGLFFGRLGNFINAELYGIQTSGSWGVIFPSVDNNLRHPTMLYEAFLEGIILFIILMVVRQKKIKAGLITGYFLIFYAIFRFGVEFIRFPDAHIGYIYYDWVTMGHLLTIPMFILGTILIFRKSA
ncbi:MAG: prolipoprotein diacylglyceryl transferase [Gammaproteobacteria bacterium]|nr:prolipoprotein diacylglyceryl transferase [Gammaproteobacteria bacterium]